ncbi:MAG: putative toxin-antitoxin system toxin component, PIN family [Candidatus Aminicenantes bacterium RBG_16_63_16]|nr:MAG: putative toxin-antitoxin system toxin component, PIN family [Candidatus Aminicenantes bacterium RBG_16_63_16]
MKVFLDTNVLVSAVATRGLCADVLRIVLESHEFVVSEALLSEMGRVLREKLGVPESIVSEYVEFIRQVGTVATPEAPVEVDIPDRADAELVSAALNGRADYFVTGDGELQRLARVGPLEIGSPRAFWQKLRSRPSKKGTKKRMDRP